MEGNPGVPFGQHGRPRAAEHQGDAEERRREDDSGDQDLDQRGTVLSA